ncbi:MAG: hypothetical protein MUE98_12395 [Rhodobacteraceae bacterium]|jgi:hypothetical protein|nr:hypothetical protein [Paracoccaceae bacterium]
MTDRYPVTPPADRWPDLLVRAFDGLLPNDLSLERLLDRIERREAERP